MLKLYWMKFIKIISVRLLGLNIQERKMTVKHNAVRQIGYIQQTLSQNKKSIGFFLGAGCPLAVRVNKRTEKGKEVSDPLIPDVAGLTKLISEELNKIVKPGEADPDKELRDSYNNLLKVMTADGILNPNIEDILTQVRSLQSVAGNTPVKGFTSAQLIELDKKICSIIAVQVGKELPGTNTPYHHLAIWTRAIQRHQSVHIFTTNYDLLIEQAFEESHAPYFDGFIGSRKAFFDLGAVENEELLHSRWSRLWKIHGSINWKLDKKGPGQARVIRSDKLGPNESYLIYPSHLKYDQSRKMPYLAMLDRLKEFLLNSPSAIFLVGYSFSDDHINDVICQALSANPTAMAYAFLFGNLDDPKYKKAKECSFANPNLSVAAFDKAIIGRIEGEWITQEEGAHYNIPKEIIVPIGDAPKEGEERKCEFKLGDFHQLGNLLKGVSGHEEPAE